MNRRARANGSCCICRDPRQHAMEVHAAKGSGLRAVAAMFGVNFRSLHRHLMLHLTEEEREARRREPLRLNEQQPRLAEEVYEELIQGGLELLHARRAAGSTDMTGYAAIMRSVREAQADLARLRGEDGSPRPGRLINGPPGPAAASSDESSFEAQVLGELQDEPELLARLERRLRGHVTDAPALPAPEESGGART